MEGLRRSVLFDLRSLRMAKINLRALGALGAFMVYTVEEGLDVNSCLITRGIYWYI